MRTTDLGRVGVAFAAGGERLIPWYTGIAAGLADAGLDLRECARFVGTSAGALVAARLAAGADPRALADELAARDAQPQPSEHGLAARLFDRLAQVAAATPTPQQRGRTIGRLTIERSPGGEEQHVERVRRRLNGMRWPDTLRIAALDADTGERVAFGRDSGAPLDRALAAARSVPLMLPPVTVGARRCIDGAIHSATNADLLAQPRIELALVVTGSPADATGLDALWNAALEHELALLNAAGIRTVVLRPGDAERAAMGPDPMSRAGAPLAARAGRAQGISTGAAAIVAAESKGSADQRTGEGSR